MQIRWGKTPIWFKLINLLFLLPIAFWPIVFFGSVFMFDNPNNNFFLMFLLFLLINGYQASETIFKSQKIREKTQDNSWKTY